MFKVGDKVKVARGALNGFNCDGSTMNFGKVGVIHEVRMAPGDSPQAHIDINFDNVICVCYQPQQLEHVKKDFKFSSLLTLGVLGLLGYVALNKSKKTNGKRSLVRKGR